MRKNYLWNMLADLKNGILLKKSFVCIKNKPLYVGISNVLWDEGYILGYKIIETDLIIFLKYVNNKSVFKSIKPITKPGRRIYFTVKQLWKLDSTKKLYVISTSKGVLSINQCKKLKAGGELLFTLQ